LPPGTFFALWPIVSVSPAWAGQTLARRHGPSGTGQELRGLAKGPGDTRGCFDSALRESTGHGNDPWLIAVVLVIWGIVTLVRGAVLTGIILIIVGLLVGPGGVSIFT
jgi:hypothetical protein